VHLFEEGERMEGKRPEVKWNTAINVKLLAQLLQAIENCWPFDVHC